jgi:hypothetical protein
MPRVWDSCARSNARAGCERQAGCVNRSSMICSNRWIQSGCLGAGTAAQGAAASRHVPRTTRWDRAARSRSSRSPRHDADAAIRKAALEIANDYSKQLRRITVSRRLVRKAPKPIATRRETWERSACGYCKEPLPRKGLKFCGRHCYLRYSVEVAKPIEKAQARLMEMRAAGLSPRHGGEAAKKRGSRISQSNRRRAQGLQNLSK